MAKRAKDSPAVETAPVETPVETVATVESEEKKRAGGRSIAKWKSIAFADYPPDLPSTAPTDIANRINQLAAADGKDYHCTTEQVVEWIAAERGEGAVGRQPRQPRATRTTTTPARPTEPTITDLLAVAAAAHDDGMTVQKLRQGVEKVKVLADKVGGLDALYSCLTALEQLQGK